MLVIEGWDRLRCLGVVFRRPWRVPRGAWERTIGGPDVKQLATLLVVVEDMTREQEDWNTLRSLDASPRPGKHKRQRRA